MTDDLRFAFRSLARRKGLFALAVATLAVGVGASTALFSLVNGVLLRPLPYDSPDRLAILWHVFGQGAQDLPALHPLDYRDYRDRSRTLEELTIATGQQLILGGDPDPQIVQVGAVAANFFTFLGIDPQLGRHFEPQEDTPGGPRVALISHRLWQSRFGGDPSVVGRMIELNTQRFEVVGCCRPASASSCRPKPTPFAIPTSGGRPRSTSTVNRPATSRRIPSSRGWRRV